MDKCSGVSTSSPMLVAVCLFDYSHHGSEAVSHCGFDLHIPMANDVEPFFMSLLAVGISSLERCPS